jgi:hypothetical protein
LVERTTVAGETEDLGKNLPSATLSHHKSYVLTYSWSWALLEKLPIVQPLLKNFPTFYGTQRFITAFTRALH